jgi:hypothetical protein
MKMGKFAKGINSFLQDLDSGVIVPWFGYAFAAFLVISLSSLIFYVMHGVATSTSGKIDFCYIQSWVPSGQTNRLYELSGHVPWGNDIRLIVTSTFDEVVQAAAKIDCPLKVK